MTGRAVVLGGGGVTGIAWEIGLLTGLTEAGVDLRADLVVGTSAGSAVGAQLTSGTQLPELFARQVDPAKQVTEIPAEIDPEQMALLFAESMAQNGDPQESWRRTGELALAAKTVGEAERRAVIAQRVPNPEWPSTRLALTAVDASTGEFVVFDRDSGVDLVDAVAASCAVPGVWPPVTIGGRRYVDGGVRSPENADLAAGSERVLVLRALLVPDYNPLDEQVRALTEQGASVLVLSPDEASLTAMGVNALDPAVREPTARAGREQGLREAERVTALWRP
ncbi:patatin-like phospholipase family protein [Kutzneria viridogrisea]|uniref:Patatin-like phospholipase n=2 Tax=Kutzneria TaxID=43356 RepID=W5W862_9PSEU|nr:patatin-like phospholipase family protein [Kutzneria albida]AHH96706.1 patatin-like phospholipase [Kutzneria albida DSM 43870]MBA8928074.1 NTE family protein [Kutzneria viridogrisea]